MQNNLVEFFLNNINYFLRKKEAIKEFLEVVKSDIPLYKIMKNTNIKSENVGESEAFTYNLTFNICNYPVEVLKLLDKETIIKYSENLYKEAYNKIMKSDYLTTLEVKDYFLYNCIYNIARSKASSNILNEIYKEEPFLNGFLDKRYINYIQIHKNSPTPLTKELFLKLFNKPALISFHFKYKHIDKKIINPETLTILEVIAYQDKVGYRCDSMISKKTKNLCKMIDKDNLYNVLFN